MSTGRTRVLLLALGTLTLLGAAADSPTEPAPTSVLKMPVRGTREKALVPFSHRNHEAKGIACARCHHVYQGGRNLWLQGQKVQRCSECHAFFPKGQQPALKNALPLQCKGCDLKLRQQSRRAGPVEGKGCPKS